MESKSHQSASARHPIQFRTSFEGQPDKPIDAVLFAFDRQGNLLASAPLKEGTATLDIPADQLRSARLFVAPAQPEGRTEKKATLEMMERQQAYEAVWQFDDKRREYVLQPIPEFLWKWWRWCLCRIRGRVVKSVLVGETTEDMPVCNARVHICEVDPIPWILLRLPDRLVLRLRDELLQELAIRRPIPLPDPPPFEVNPGYIDPSPENIARANRVALGLGDQVALNPQPLPPKAMIERLRQLVELNPQPEPPIFKRLNISALNPQPEPPRLQLRDISAINPQPEPPGTLEVNRASMASGESNKLASLPLETQIALQSPAAATVRQALQSNVGLIRPYFCYWRWLWPWFCRCDEIAVVTTDAQGRFDIPYWYLCAFDHPDIYFWIEYSVGGSWTTVYHPNPICCYTFWNYACGSEVTIHVTDPRVYPCGNPPPDLPGKVVSVLSIGQYVSLHQIPIDSTGTTPLSPNVSEGLAWGTSPFGGVLEPRVYFSRSALIGSGITHYRWSYHQISDANLAAVSDGWHDMDRQVIRHYALFDPVHSTLSFPPEPMGPDPAYPGLNLFKIQPINAPTGHPEDWAPIDAHEDLASAFFQSQLTHMGDAALGAGKYELRLELFNTSGATPTVVDWTASGVGAKVADVDAPFGAGDVTTVDADNHYKIVDGSGHMVAFRMVVHVDNNVCTSALYPISGTGLAVDADCGFVIYQPNTQAHLSFMAHHPHDYVTFNFRVVRGVSIDVPTAESAGQVTDPPAVLNGYARAGDVFSKDVDVDTLLTENTPTGHTECTKAAFAETLHVWAMATDGWQRCSWLDPIPNPQSAAFALEPA